MKYRSQNLCGKGEQQYPFQALKNLYFRVKSIKIYRTQSVQKSITKVQIYYGFHLVKKRLWISIMKYRSQNLCGKGEQQYPFQALKNLYFRVKSIKIYRTQSVQKSITKVQIYYGFHLVKKNKKSKYVIKNSQNHKPKMLKIPSITMRLQAMQKKV